MCCCNCNKESKYLVLYKWKSQRGLSYYVMEEATEFVTTDNIEQWWWEFKDEDDKLVSISKL